MKKLLLFLMTCVLFLSLHAQTIEVQIGTGTSTNSGNTGLPGWYGYSLAYQTYTPTEITMPGLIESIDFEITTVGTSATGSRKLKIYMMEIPVGTPIAENQSWNTLISQATLVYTTINFQPTANSWSKIILDQPYIYTGTGNLVILLEGEGCTTGGGCSVTSRHHTVTAASGLTKAWLRDNQPHNLDANLSTLTVGQSNANTMRANIRLSLGFLDNFCYPPSSIVASNITAFTANVSWETHGTGSSYEYQYKLASDIDWSATQTTTTPTISLTGLISNSNYQIRVRSICASLGDESIWVTSNFKTQCESITTLPWTENFDTYGADAFPPCMFRPVIYENFPRTVSAQFASSPYSLRFQSNLQTIAITPRFERDVTELMVAFKLRREGASSGTFQVGVVTDPSDINSFIPVQTFDPTSGLWHEFDVMLNTAGTEAHYIGFKQIATGNNWYYWLDDIEVDVIPPCSRPAVVNVVPAGLSAVASWDPVFEENQWLVSYKLASSSEWSNEVLVSEPTYTIASLIGVTSYNVRVRAFCGEGDTSSYRQANFTTLISCRPPTNLALVPGTISYFSASVNWRPNTQPSDNPGPYEVQYKLSYEADWTPLAGYINDTVVEISGLLSASTYNIRIRQVCTPDTDLSTWSSTLNITTLTSCPAPSNLAVIGSTILANGATLNWRSPSTAPYGDFLNYIVEYKIDGTDWSTAVVENVADTFITLTGLTTSTLYNVRVRIACTGDENSTWITANFRTICENITELPWIENFDSYASATFPPCMFRPVINENFPRTVTSQFSSSPNSLQFSSSLQTIAITPRFERDATELMVTFRLRREGSGSGTFQVGVVTDPTNMNSFTPVQTINQTPNSVWQEFEVMLNAAEVTGAHYIGFKQIATTNNWYYWLDDIKVDIAPNVDMAAISITGPAILEANTSYDYNITVRNRAQNPASNYTVKIMTEAGEILSQRLITDELASLTTTTLILPVTFSSTLAESLNIKGVVEIENDEVPANNETSLFAVRILSETETAGTIGTGTATSSAIPFSFNYRSSVVQSIYLESEIQAGFGIETGQITQIRYHYNATSALSPARDIKVYMTTTSLNSLSAFIPTEQFILVYEGTAAIPVGAYELVINLDVPFDYTGGNLCIMTYRPYEPAGLYNSNGWQSGIDARVSTVAPTNRTRYRQLDGDAPGVTPDNLSGGISLSTIANITMIMQPIYYKLNPSNIILGDGASITLDGDSVLFGENGTVRFSVDNCNTFIDVIIGGVSEGAITDYTFENMTGPFPIIEIVTTPIYYDIIVTHNENGIVEPAGTISARCGERQTFQIEPEEGYTIEAMFYNNQRVNVPPTTRIWTTPAVTSSGTFNVLFREYPYSINISIEGEGTVVLVEEDGSETEMVPGLLGVDSAMMYHFKFYPAVSSGLNAVYVDGILKPTAVVSHSYLFLPINSDHDFRVVFELRDINVFASAGSHGTITPIGNVPVTYGTSQLFTFIPSVGYIVDQVFVNNESVPFTGDSYELTNVTEPSTIFVTFTRATVYITANASSGCGSSTISPNGTVPVLYNDHITFTFVPDEGCRIVQVLVNDISYPPAVQTGSYTFYYVTQPHTIEVIYEKIPYPIRASINGNGTISDAGTTYVDHGDSKTYTFSANAGYKIVNVFVDGVNNIAAVNSGSYTFTNVRESHTISVITAIETYIVNATAGAGGWITPAGNITVNHGQNRTFNFTPATGFMIDMVLINGVENDDAVVDGFYTFTNIVANHTINVTFALQMFRMSAIAGANGSIYPMGIMDVEYGEEVTYYITPDNGYQISYVLVNGENVGAINTYTFTEIDADGEIEVFFSPLLGIGKQTIDGVSIYSQSNIVNIVNTKLLPIHDVSIFDMYGRIVWQGKASDRHNTITLDVANGVYTVRVATDNQFTTTKVSIQR